MSGQSYYLRVENAREQMRKAWSLCEAFLQYGTEVRVHVEEYEPTRTNEQNKKMWAMLGDLSKQLDWPVNGVMRKLTSEEWKDVMTAAQKSDSRVAAGVDGGFVVLGTSTRNMTIKKMADLITLMQAFGDQRNIVWSDPDAT